MIPNFYRISVPVLIFCTMLCGTARPAVENLALNRPVSVSSTDHAPAQGEFAVDGETQTGWRARFFVDYDKGTMPVRTLPQWIAVDLQAKCALSSVRIFCEADASTPVYVEDRRFTLGHEVYSSYPVRYRIEGSDTGEKWTVLARVSDGRGGWMETALPAGSWRFVRVLIEEVSSNLPVGINELEIYGTCGVQRPSTNGWKERRKPKTAFARELRLRSSSVLPVTEEWEMTCEGWNGADEGEKISRPGFPTASWYDATVPGTVVATLVEQEVFPDPVAGLNNLKIPEVLCRRNWWYRRAFRLPEGFDVRGRRVLLEADKVNHHADFWVNGHRVGEIDRCFVQGAFDVTRYLDPEGENVVAVRICPMEKVGVPGDKGAAGNAWVNSRVISRSSPTYICSSGWDWMPAMRDRGIGILEEVRLRTVGDVMIEHPHVQTDLDLPDTTRAFVWLNVPVRNGSGSGRQVTVRAAFDRVAVERTVTVAPGETLEVKFGPDTHKQLKMSRPKLWWPNGYGPQNLYDLTVTASVDGKTSDTYRCRFGVRKITYNAPLSKERRGSYRIERTEARYVRILMEESCVDRFGMFDLSVYDSRDVENDLAAWKKTEVSSVRAPKYPASNLTDVRGVSKWFSAGDRDEWALVDLGERRSFDWVIAGWDSDGLAARYKIQVSDDKRSWRTVRECTESPTPHLVVSVNGVRIFCKGGNWGLEELALRMPRERMETALRFHRDSKMNMIRAWMGNFLNPDFFDCCDEYGVLVFSDLWGGHPDDKVRYCEIARENIIRFRNHPSIALWCASNETYPAIVIDRSIRKAVRECDSTRLYMSHSADDIVWGGEGPYFWLPPEEYYRMAHGFKSEIGLPTVPVYETMLRMCGQDQAWPIGETWYYHDYSAKSGQAISRYIDAFTSRLGPVTSMEDYCRKAQFINYDNIRAMFEAWNHKLWKDCSGVLLWMTHPAWYSTVWQTYDYDFEVNGTWAGAKKGCESHHVQASLPDWKVDAVNHTARHLKGVTVTAAVYDVSGKQYGKTQRMTLDIPASDMVPAFAVDFAPGLPPLHFVRLEMRGRRGELLSENFYWRYDKPEDMRLLNEIGDARIEAVADRYERDGRSYWRVELTNRGRVVGAMIRLSLRDAGTDERILPALYTDNYFWMLPGERKTVLIDCDSSDAGGRLPAVCVSGYNLPVFRAETR